MSVSPVHLPRALLDEYVRSGIIPPSFNNIYKILNDLVSKIEGKQASSDADTIYLLMATLLNPLSSTHGLYATAIPVIPECEQFRYTVVTNVATLEGQYHQALMNCWKSLSSYSPPPITTSAYYEGLLIKHLVVQLLMRQTMQTKEMARYFIGQPFIHLLHPSLQQWLIQK